MQPGREERRRKASCLRRAARLAIRPCRCRHRGIRSTTSLNVERPRESGLRWTEEDRKPEPARPIGLETRQCLQPRSRSSTGRLPQISFVFCVSSTPPHIGERQAVGGDSCLEMESGKRGKIGSPGNKLCWEVRGGSGMAGRDAVEGLRRVQDCNQMVGDESGQVAGRQVSLLAQKSRSARCFSTRSET